MGFFASFASWTYRGGSKIFVDVKSGWDKLFLTIAKNITGLDGWMDSLIYFIRGPATTTQASLRDRAYSRGEWRESGRSAKYI